MDDHVLSELFAEELKNPVVESDLEHPMNNEEDQDQDLERSSAQNYEEDPAYVPDIHNAERDYQDQLDDHVLDELFQEELKNPELGMDYSMNAEEEHDLDLERSQTNDNEDDPTYVPDYNNTERDYQDQLDDHVLDKLFLSLIHI